MAKKIEIYDTTLRDGGQSEGINFSASDKLNIIKALDNFGVDYIEAGWPGANPVDIEVFDKLKNIKLKKAEIAAFGCTRKAGVKASEDTILANLLSAETKVITIFGKSWDFHVKHALNTTLNENLDMIESSVSYLKSQKRIVFFDAEHFFDGYKNNPTYAIETLQAAAKGGAERIILCDTNGGSTSSEIHKITSVVKKEIPNIELGIHSHNDSEIAVGGAVSAVEAGATQVQGTINGYGERCGNTNLCSIIPILQIKQGYDVVGDNISKLVELSKEVAEIANMMFNDRAAFVGKSAFAHKAGVHASGVRKHSETYEHIHPETVGNERRILVSDQAGAASLREKFENMTLDINVSKEDIPHVIKKLKEAESQGYAYENADASFELLVADVVGQKKEFFKLIGFRVIEDTFGGIDNINTEASVKIDINGEIIHTVSEGEGPVNALDIALRKALITKYPVIENFKLSDFKVRIVDSLSGTNAKTVVQIEFSNGSENCNTVGVSKNIIEASYIALIDGILYGLMSGTVK
jgi:2-isopropylmalate synthase